MTLYDWAGSEILFLTLADNKRWMVFDPAPGDLIDNKLRAVATDFRAFIAQPESYELKQAVRNLREMYGMPIEKDPTTFDQRAALCWKYVLQTTTYVPDDNDPETWQYPCETLTRAKGDCEDLSFLLVSLLLASGISPFCVRVVFGTLQVDNDSIEHAWVIYKAEDGLWRLLESTLDDDVLPVSPSLDDLFMSLPLMDDVANGMPSPNGETITYTPARCLNQFHFWKVRAI